MGLNIKEYILDEAAVETVSADLQAYMQGLGADRKSTFAGIMIAFTMCSGILNVGDTMTLGRMGRHTLSRFVLISFLVSVTTTAMVVPSLGLSLSGNAGENYVNTGFNVLMLMLQMACTGKAWAPWNGKCCYNRISPKAVRLGSINCSAPFPIRKHPDTFPLTRANRIACSSALFV